MMRILGWLLGLEDVTSIEQIDPALAAPWAQGNGFWIVFFIAALLVLSITFYWRFQSRGSAQRRFGLALMRGAILGLLVITLANPILRLTINQVRPPLFYLVFDGTESMAIEDEYAVGELSKLAAATELPADVSAEGASRLDLVQAYLRKPNNLLDQLQENDQVRLEAFQFDDRMSGQLRKLKSNRGGQGGDVDSSYLAEQLAARGRVTALGTALQDINKQIGAGRLAGVVFLSDFAHNSGVAPLGGDGSEADRQGPPIYTVGVGADEALDLAVTLQTAPKMKRAEPTSIYVKVRQLGLQGQSATVRVTARQQSGATDGGEIEVGEKTIPLNSSLEFIEFPFTPEDAGRFQFTARAEVLDGEVLEENNQAVRSVNIVDDFLRLQYVAHEPNWEWRFVKEVFHRDKLVGMEGFRTFLASSDPRVRQSNVLFAPTLTPSRKEFFQSDVIFLGDMPREAISDRFAEMVQEFVGNLGGGLVVISGPRFGPQALIGTPLADMLPVKLDPDSSIQDDREFRMELSPHAARYAFMQLGDNATEQQRAWDNLGRLPWRQPVAAVHEQAVVLAEHPSARCRDGKTPQPIIAIRPYGRGEVCFLAFDEMWRLRRRFGEKYYRAFWSKLIYRLGMSHDLGPDKRFVPALDRQKYRSGDRVVLTVDAYDENYDPLQEEDLPNRALTAELTTPVDGGGATARNLPIPFLRSGLFEARIPVFAAGEYVLRIDDPVTGRQHERRFEVTEVSAERRRATRDAHLQTELARKSGGQAYDLATVEGLVDDIRVEPTVERLTRNHPLWTTPLWFVLVVGLMLSEWLFRKLNHLA